MHIKNKILRLLVSVVMAILLFFLLNLVLAGSEVIASMWDFINSAPKIAIPFLLFMTSISYLSFTEKNSQSGKIMKILATALIAIIIILALIFVFLEKYTNVLML